MAKDSDHAGDGEIGEARDGSAASAFSRLGVEGRVRGTQLYLCRFLAVGSAELNNGQEPH